MKPKYLGDCLDFYKRWFLAEFFPGQQLAAVPMLTQPWLALGDAAVYSTLLGVEVIQPALIPNHAARADYFRPVQADSSIARDVFFDPDTGLRVGACPSRSRFDEYLFDHELESHVLIDGSSRVAVVYDQSIARGREVASADMKIRALRNRNLWAFAYCAQVAMVIVSHERTRIEEMYQRAKKLTYLPPDRVRINW